MGVNLNNYLGWGGQLTHRQSLLWREFREYEMNTPSRTDFYIMSLTATVARIMSKTPQSIQTDNFKLTFKHKNEVPTEEEIKKQIEFSKSMWIGALGGMKGVTIKDKDGNILKHPEGKLKVRVAPQVNQQKPIRQLGKKRRR